MTEELCYLPASDALALFRRRELSPVELMQATIDRVEALDRVVNALPIRFFDEALAAARAAEARYAGRGARPAPARGPARRRQGRGRGGRPAAAPRAR